VPHWTEVMVQRVEQNASGVQVWARAKASTVACPGCDRTSARVHSRYDRRIADAVIVGRPVVLRLQVRRLFCTNGACPKRTFAEQVPGLTTPYARRSPVLRGMVESIGLALAGRAGARLARKLGLPVSRDTLVRLVRALADPPVGTVTVLGVDDFAVKRGQNYATILLDMTTHRPIDVLPGRDADTLADWLARHPEITVITRDRSGSYAEAASRGAPQATQCADRWHLWKNLGDAVEKTVIAHRGCIPEPEVAATNSEDTGVTNDIEPTNAVELAPLDAPVTGTPTLAVPAEAANPDDRHVLLRTRTEERYAAVQQLRAQGKGMRTIAAELDIDRKTARRFSQAASAEDIIAKATSRVMLLDAFIPYLLQRWHAGCTDIPTLTTELQHVGYRGSATPPPPAKPTPPKIRTVVSWIMRHPDNLSTNDDTQLQQILACCPELAATRRHVSAFAIMIRDLRGDHLADWMDHVHADNLPALHSFVTGVRHDLAAVTAGLTLPWNNGPTEGTVSSGFDRAVSLPNALSEKVRSISTPSNCRTVF
jgi:transposase